MRLNELICDCFDSSQFKQFLFTELTGDGRSVWHAVPAGAWSIQSSELVEELRKRNRINRQLFEALVRSRPGRADDIAASCRHETNQPLNYVVGDLSAQTGFPWGSFRSAMTVGLQFFLGYAAYDARSRGYTAISTSEMFRVYRAMQPWVALAIPNGCHLEEAPCEQTEEFDGLGASNCVRKTICGLAKHTQLGRQFSEHDVFLDLARFGSGGSAVKLVPNGETLEGINDLSRKLKIGRVTRHGELD